jgi:hypothetical protein
LSELGRVGKRSDETGPFSGNLSPLN